MSQVPQQPVVPRAYSVWPQNTTSDNSFMPPAKRQRLSPDPTSPYGVSPLSQSSYATSPNLQNISLPNAFASRATNGFAQQQQRPVTGTMGPPQRPAEKPSEEKEKYMDVNDLNDLVTSSGIDINEEEKYLTSYRMQRPAAPYISQQPQTPATISTFDLLSQTDFRNIGAGRGFFGQPPSEKTPEEELYEKHKLAARRLAENHQHHLDDPFLQGVAMRVWVEKHANDNGVKLPVEGLFDRIRNRPVTVSGVSMTGADGSQIVAVHAPSILNRNAPLEAIFSLLSLAANERIRGLLEDAYGISRGRRLGGADGVVPPEWADVARGIGPVATMVVPESVSNTAWDAVSSAHRLPSPPNSDAESPKPPNQPVPTIAFTSNPVSDALMALAKQDRQAEEARLKKRAERAKMKQKAEANARLKSEADGGAANVNGEGKLGERAPEMKLTKKEEKKLAKQTGISDEVATRNANETAMNQLGGRTYNWMQKMKPTVKPMAQASSFMGASTATIGSANSAAVKKDGLDGIADRKFGTWKESDVGGRGVQLRDWVSVLESDGRARKTCAWALAKLGSEKA